MKMQSMNDRKPVNRVKDYPELQVGFPERNEIVDPIGEMERVHVDIETLDLSRKNAREVTRELTDSERPEQKRSL